MLNAYPLIFSFEQHHLGIFDRIGLFLKIEFQ